MWTRAQLKMNGKQVFRRNYWECVVASLIMGIFTASTGLGFGNNANLEINQDGVSGSFSSNFLGSGEAREVFSALFAVSVVVLLVLGLIGLFLKIFVGNVFIVGGNCFYIKNRTGKPGMGTVLEAFRSRHYKNVVLTMFMKDLYVFLWSLLLIIPGIIKSYEYFMVPYIMAENPGMNHKEAFAISKRMMDGQKWDTFVLELSFFGWLLLGGFTCGILNVFYVAPYMQATCTELYAFNKIKAYNEGYIR